MKKYILKLKEKLVRVISTVRLWFRREPTDLYSEENLANFVAGINNPETSKLLMLLLANTIGASISNVYSVESEFG
jgi:hypothetical protein